MPALLIGWYINAYFLLEKSYLESKSEMSRANDCTLYIITGCRWVMSICQYFLIIYGVEIKNYADVKIKIKNPKAFALLMKNAAKVNLTVSSNWI